MVFIPHHAEIRVAMMCRALRRRVGIVADRRVPVVHRVLVASGAARRAGTALSHLPSYLHMWGIGKKLYARYPIQPVVLGGAGAYIQVDNL